MDRADITLICIISMINLIMFFLFYKYQYTPYRAKCRKYKLYRLRDEFIYLAASEKVAESSLIFSSIYPFINDLIDKTATLNLSNLIKAMINSTEEKKIENEQFVKELKKEVSLADPAAKKTVEIFYDTMTDILIDNSIILKLLLKNKFNRMILKCTYHASSLTQKIFRNDKVAWEKYNTYQNNKHIFAT